LNLYTCILDVLGGSYVSQVEANDEIGAFIQWAEKLRRDRFVPDHSERLAAAFMENLEMLEATPAALNGLTGAWYEGCSLEAVGDARASLHIVLTQRTSTVH
jgi:hypothetical protein